jgi:UDP-glucose:(heptosyl)LPS alpha-1,3-glucosyltransferase
VVHCHEKGVACDVTTVHTYSYLHGFEHFSWLKKINTLYLSPRGLLYYWLEKKQLRSSAVVAVSEIIRRDIQRYFPETNPIHTTTPGVDLSLFKPNQTADGRNTSRPDRPDGNLRDLNVLFVGSEFRRKGLDQLIPSLPESARLVVVGKGEHLSHYHQLVKRAGLEANVVFKGLVDNVCDYYAKADVFVLPSLREAFGMAVLEAMACGLPVVVSSTTGVADLIDDGHNGFVFKSARELTSILRRLFDRELRQRIGANARQTAMRHTWDKAADEYESIYWNIYQKK